MDTGLLERLARRGFRMTAQRRVIAETLCGPNLHLTAEEIHQRAAAALPELSRATVYNTLAELVALGEITEFTPVTGGPRRYDPNHFHQHLVCVDCGMIRDVYPENQRALQVRPEERADFEILDVEIVFHGRCGTCAARRDAPSRRG
jgi:Fur family ferric uptake transcriptional regulator